MSDGATRQPTQSPSALPVGTRLGEFELLGLLGVGGFGIVYLAFDHALEREVAIKEYMPASLAGRSETMHVSIRSHSDAETFALGRKSFVNEAKMLARFDHPSLLKVHRFWEANGTAYMAMPVMRGRTVKDIRLEMRDPPGEAWLRALLDPLLGAIERLHSEGVYHRDIAPDNIQIEPDGRPVLLDFGAARRVIGDKSQALTAILKPAYAPIEQYAEVGAVKQGPWTDIYALGATLHFLLLGRPPPPATARAIHDDASALTTMALPDCSEDFLHIVDWMLAPRPTDRPQSVAALRDVLEGRAPIPLRHVPAQHLVSDWDRTVVRPAAGTTAVSPRTALPDEEATLVLPPSARTTVLRTTAMARPAAAPATAPPPTPGGGAPAAAAPAGNGRSKMLPVGIGVGALVMAAAAAVALWPRPSAPPAGEVVAASAPAPAASVAAPPVPAAPMVAESTVATVVVPPAPAPAPTPSPGVATTTAAPGNDAAAAPRPAPASVVTPPAATLGRTATAAKTHSPPALLSTAMTPAAAAASAQPVATAQPAPPAPARASKTESVAASTPPSLTTQPVAEAPKPVLQAPEARCAGRSPLSYFVCMEKECLKSEQMATADCKKWRQNARSPE